MNFRKTKLHHLQSRTAIRKEKAEPDKDGDVIIYF